MERGSKLLDCTQTATGKVKSVEWSLPTFESGSDILQLHIFRICLHVLGGFVIKNGLNRNCRSLFQKSCLVGVGNICIWSNKAAAEMTFSSEIHKVLAVIGLWCCCYGNVKANTLGHVFFFIIFYLL